MSNTVARKSADVRLSGVSDTNSLYARDGGRKYLNREERRRALAGIASLPTDRRLFALTLAWTGARVSEVLALTPAAFQVEAGRVALVTLKRRRHAVREVPIPPELMGELEAAFGLTARQADPARRQARLWPWHRATAWRLIREVMGDCGLEGRAASPTSYGKWGFRHGFGVGALQAGAPLNLVQRWLGHARMDTTALYTDASGPEETALAARFWRAEALAA